MVLLKEFIYCWAWLDFFSPFGVANEKLWSVGSSEADAKGVWLR